MIDVVAEHIRRVAEEIIRPRFRGLEAAEVSEKGPDDLVTIADVEAERELTAALQALTPGVPVVGEEAVAADPRVLRAVAAERAWIVDPIDGTGNFVEGSVDYGVMVALTDRGETVAGWIHQPERGSMLVAERGSGAHLDGRRLGRADEAIDVEALSGTVKPRYLPRDVAETVAPRLGMLADARPGTNSAAVEYACVAEADPDFVMFWMTKPWDHAAGSLIVEEAGGWSRRLDATPYRPDQTGSGLLVAGTPSIWRAVRDTLLAGVVSPTIT